MPRAENDDGGVKEQAFHWKDAYTLIVMFESPRSLFFDFFFFLIAPILGDMGILLVTAQPDKKIA
jgi:hypothetical protein